MQGYINVYVAEEKISVGDKSYTLGELAVSAMNVSDDTMKELGRELLNIEKRAVIARGYRRREWHISLERPKKL